MPREKTITVYKFSELSPEAKVYVKEQYAERFGYSWSEEAFDSLKGLAEHFDGRLVNWSVDFFDGSPSSAAFDMPDEMAEEEIRRRLEALGSYDRKTLKGHGDCKLTGFMADESAIDGFRFAFVREKQRELGALMQAAFRSWLAAGIADCKDQYSDETFSETADANEYEYDEKGRRA